MEAFFQLLAVVGGILLIIIAFAKAVFWYEAKKERGKCSVETYRKFKQARDIYHTCLIIGESGRARKIMDYWEDRVEQEGGPQAKNQACGNAEDCTISKWKLSDSSRIRKPILKRRTEQWV